MDIDIKPIAFIMLYHIKWVLKFSPCVAMVEIWKYWQIPECNTEWKSWNGIKTMKMLIQKEKQNNFCNFCRLSHQATLSTFTQRSIIGRNILLGITFSLMKWKVTPPKNFPFNLNQRDRVTARHYHRHNDLHFKHI